MPARPDRLKRELLVLVGLVLALDVAFGAGYYLGGLGRAGGQVKLVYTVVWTAATLLLVLRGLGRIRAERIRGRR